MGNVLKLIAYLVRASQVELKGRYSVERMHEFKRYCSETSYWHAAAIILATPLPCLVLCLLADAIPLPDPSGGMRTSTIVWLRSFIVLGVMTWTQMDQCRRFVDKIPQTMGFTIFATLFITSGCVLTQIVVGFTVGYPVPFAMVMAAPAWITSYLILFVAKFGRFIMHNKEARYDLICFTAMMATEVTMGIGYPMYSVAFYGLHSYARMAFTLVLPMMKLALKVVFHRLSSKHEDLLPEVVIFNIEVYHSLFVACYMQSATSMSTSFILMAINAVRAVLSIYDVFIILRSIERRCKGMPSLAKASRPALLDIAGYILAHTVKARRHNSIRLRSEHRTSMAVNSSTGNRLSSNTALTGIATTAKKTATKILPRRRDQTTQLDAVAAAAQPRVASKADAFDLHHLTWAINGDDKVFIDSLSENDRILVAVDILQLFHVTEFLTLIQFAEVMIPVLYSTYLFVVYHFPNRKYYTQMRDLDEHQLGLTIQNVLLYALLELVSLLVVAWILQEKLRISVVKQLAFVLRAEWADVQSRLLFWVSYIFQNFLEQFVALSPQTSISFVTIPLAGAAIIIEKQKDLNEFPSPRESVSPNVRFSSVRAVAPKISGAWSASVHIDASDWWRGFRRFQLPQAEEPTQAETEPSLPPVQSLQSPEDFRTYRKIPFCVEIFDSHSPTQVGLKSDGLIWKFTYLCYVTG